MLIQNYVRKCSVFFRMVTICVHVLNGWIQPTLIWRRKGPTDMQAYRQLRSVCNYQGETKSCTWWKHCPLQVERFNVFCNLTTPNIAAGCGQVWTITPTPSWDIVSSEVLNGGTSSMFRPGAAAPSKGMKSWCDWPLLKLTLIKTPPADTAVLLPVMYSSRSCLSFCLRRAAPALWWCLWLMKLLTAVSNSHSTLGFA